MPEAKVKWVNGIACLPDEASPSPDPETEKVRKEAAAAVNATAWQKLLQDTRNWAKRHGYNLPEVVLVETAATCLGQLLPPELHNQVQQKLFAILAVKLDPRRRLGP